MLDPDKYEIHIICDNTNYQFGIERIRQIQKTEMCKQWNHEIYVDPTKYPSPATAYAKAREAIKTLEQSQYLNKIQFHLGTFVNGKPKYALRADIKDSIQFLKEIQHVGNRTDPSFL